MQPEGNAQGSLAHQRKSGLQVDRMIAEQNIRRQFWRVELRKKVRGWVGKMGG